MLGVKIDMTVKQKVIKRMFDVSFALFGLVVFSWLILVAWVVASIDTRSNGFFLQKRVGQYGRVFKVIKIKSMRPVKNLVTTVTTKHDTRITVSGAIFRRFKIDELPQLFNVLKVRCRLLGLVRMSLGLQIS